VRTIEALSNNTSNTCFIRLNITETRVSHSFSFYSPPPPAARDAGTKCRNTIVTRDKTDLVSLQEAGHSNENAPQTKACGASKNQKMGVI
ncbi:MAG: hypothetical protein ACI819_002645, partial [Neolewinella sp.]